MSRPSRRLKSRLSRVFVVVVSGIAIVTAISLQHSTRASARSGHGRALAQTPANPAPAYHGKGADSHYCNGCTPPLLYSPGGSVVATSGAAGFTITPVFWEPAGASPANQTPASYQQIVTGYVNNVAAGSGATSNVYSIATEYSSTVNGVKTPINYKITAGTPIIDTSPLPPNGCTPNAANGYTSCVSDLQLRTELTKVLTAKGLPSDLAHFYPVFFPPNTETEGPGGPSGGNSDADYCGYHGAYVSGSGETVYGNEPYENGGCDGGEGPNGNVIADGAVGVFSHEVSETMTDPNGLGILTGPAWGDTTGHEIGDECSGYYGPPIGSTDPANPGTTAYNQVINGGKYYTQTEFSNAAFKRIGIGGGCQPSETAAQTSPFAVVAGAAMSSPAASPVGQVDNDPFPNMLDANGTATSVLDIGVSDHEGFSVAGDRVNYSTYAVTGLGSCGQLSAANAFTDAGGHASVTYTASTANVICAIVANELDGGQGATAYIYQGTYQRQAITATHAFPTSLTLGQTAQFQTTFGNPSDVEARNARVDFVMFPGSEATDNIEASEVSLSYSLTGPSGPYHPVHLIGSTIVDGAVQGVALPPAGVGIAPHGTLRVDYRMTLSPRISTAGKGAGFSFESYLDEIDPASGAISTAGDTLARDARVLP